MSRNSGAIQNERLDEIRKARIDVRIIFSVKSFFLQDHSIVIIGAKNHGDSSQTSSVEWISPDLKDNEIYDLMRNYISTIFDAIPTGKQGEFVLTRNVSPSSNIFSPTEKRTGVVLTFVQIK